jgi:hypothetical protein
VSNNFLIDFIYNSNVKISQAPVDEEEFDIPALKDRLADFNINDSSPDYSGNAKTHSINLCI